MKERTKCMISWMSCWMIFWSFLISFGFIICMMMSEFAGLGVDLKGTVVLLLIFIGIGVFPGAFIWVTDTDSERQNGDV